MLNNIREIGIFMIAAQAVIHFAPGKQYEKYIKSVSGIIILLLFLRPFLQFSGVAWTEPEAILEKLPELTQMPAFPGVEEGTEQWMSGGMGAGTGGAVISAMETEVKERLNRELEGENYRVKRVSLQIAEDPLQEGQATLTKVEVTLTETTEQGDSLITVDEIVVGGASDGDEESAFLSYRSRFAVLLGIEEERVEVKRDGRG